MDFQAYTIEPLESLFVRLKTSSSGLSTDEAKKRQTQYGVNKLEQKKFGWLSILMRQFTLPFIYLLCAASVISLFLGNIIEALLIIFFILINSLLGFYQEYKAQQTVQMLNKYLVSQSKVWRDNHLVMVDSEMLVPGDVIMLEPGDIIPADVRFIQEHNLMVDESELTGESSPVKKISEPLEQPAQELFNAFNIGNAGTIVVQGKAIAVVLAIGEESYRGGISKLSLNVIRETIFAREIGEFSHFIIIVISITLVVVFIINLIIKGSHANIAELLIFSIALAVTITPEALPIVITFCLSRGALHLARNKVVVKRLSAIEDLGSIDILCSDKTGTLTENKLAVAEIYGDDSQKILLYGALASSSMFEHSSHLINPIDRAFWMKLDHEQQRELYSYQKRYEVPFDPLRLRNDVIVENDHTYDLIVRGVVDTIIDRCLNAEKQKAIAWSQDQEKKGNRVIVIAHKLLSEAADYKTEAMNEKDLILLGMVSLFDPIKSDVANALIKAQKLGVTIKILTGDSAEVAGTVGYTIGLVKNPADVMTGSEFDRLPEEEKQSAVYDYAIFARVTPEQKFSIIQLLQEKNQVGYLGDGINDAPALKVAHVGLAVQGAVDSARDAADIILLKKSLNIIVDGIYEGRIVYANTIKYIKTTLASNFGNFYSVAISSLFINYLPMLPLQILLVNLLSDLPMIALSGDTVEGDELRSPKSYNFKDIIIFCTFLGLVSSIFDFILFAFFYRMMPKILQTNWFIESILTELVLIYSLRTRKLFFKAKFPSWSLLSLTLLAGIITIILPFTQFGQHFFSFIMPKTSHLMIVLLLVVLYAVATEITKLCYYRMLNHKKG